MKNITINNNNYESIFLSYIDNELTTSEKQDVEDFLQSNPTLIASFELLKQTKIQPEAIQFMQKHLLYRQEEEEVFPLPIPQQVSTLYSTTNLNRWYYLAAAVCIGIIWGLFHFIQSNNVTTIIAPDLVTEKLTIAVDSSKTIQRNTQIIQPSANTKTIHPIQQLETENVAAASDNIVVATIEENLDSPTVVLQSIAASSANQRDNFDQANTLQVDKTSIASVNIAPMIAIEDLHSMDKPVITSPKKGLHKLKAFIKKIDNQLDALTSNEPTVHEHSLKIVAFTIPLKK